MPNDWRMDPAVAEARKAIRLEGWPEDAADLDRLCDAVALASAAEATAALILKAGARDPNLFYGLLAVHDKYEAEYHAYAPLPTPAPAKEPEARTNLLGRGGLNAALVELEARVRAIDADRLWTEINGLARKADDFDWKINGLLARVRALEGK